MYIIIETNLSNFKSWAGATDTKEVILKHSKEQEFDDLIVGLYPDGLDETQLNDILWFEEDWIFEQLGIEAESK